MAAVLIVDDDREIRETVVLALEDVGYTVSQASDGQAAISYLQQTDTPHVVILDSFMPIMNGEEFLQTVLHDLHMKTHHTFIYMTARVQRPDSTMAEMLTTHGIPLISKPFDLDMLLDTVATSVQHLATLDSTSSSSSDIAL